MRSKIFRLMAVLGGLWMGSAALAEPFSSKEDKAEISRVQLNTDNVTRVMVTTDAMNRVLKGKPDLKKSVDAGEAKDSEATLAKLSQKMSDHPELSSIISAHGFTPRDYLATEVALVHASLVAAIGQGDKAAAEQLAAEYGVKAGNVTFVQSHKAEIEALSKKYPLQSSDD